MDKHWSGYLNAVGGNSVPLSSMPAPYLTSDSSKGNVGFLDLTVPPKKEVIQAKYDAMQGSWEGVKASDAAISQGVFKTESMPVNLPPYQGPPKPA
jgi:hypothetical protein